MDGNMLHSCSFLALAIFRELAWQPDAPFIYAMSGMKSNSRLSDIHDGVLIAS
jgi:hypothetical protein